MCFMVVFIGYFLQQFENLQPKWDWFRLTLVGISITFGSVGCYKPQIISNRIFFIFCVFGCMIFVITTMSVMFKIMTNPIYENQVKTIEEIVNRFDLVGDEFALQHLMRQNEVIFSSIDALLQKRIIKMSAFFFAGISIQSASKIHRL